MANNREKTSVSIDKNLWKEFRHMAIDKNKEISELLEEAIANALKKKKGG